MVTRNGFAAAFLSQRENADLFFGLPAASLAMYHTAAPANRHKIKGLLLSGVIATAITGITEPIEFLFLFISPLLWLFHVIMTGLGFMVMALLGVVIGNTDGGLLDFVILACYKELIQNGGGFSLSALSGLLFIISSLKQSL